MFLQDGARLFTAVANLISLSVKRSPKRQQLLCADWTAFWRSKRDAGAEELGLQ